MFCLHCGERIDNFHGGQLHDPAPGLNYILVEIHHWLGINLLGVLLLLVIAFGMWGGIEIEARLQNRTIGAMLFFASVLFSAALDIAWRLSRGEHDYANRLFSPFAGGCMLYLPIWTHVVLGAMAVVFMAVSHK